MMASLYASVLQIFDWVIRGSFMASILVVLVLFLQFFLKKKLEARWMYLLWLPVALRLLLPWTPESSLSIYNILPEKLVTLGIQQQNQAPLLSSGAWMQSAGKGEIAVEESLFSSPENSKSLDQTSSLIDQRPASALANESSLRWKTSVVTILLLIWLSGVVLLAAKTGYEQTRLKQALRAGRTIETPQLLALFQETKNLIGVTKKVQFVASERIPGPAVVGFYKPVVVISPQLLVTLRQEQLQYILAHECAHIRRQDVAVNWILHIILIFHWFNPFIWLALFKARQDQEMACDAYVLDRLKPQQNHIYGQTIIHVLEHFAGNRQQPGLAGMSSTHEQMKRRLLMIKHFHKKSYSLSILGISTILALSSVSLVDAKPSASSIKQSAVAVAQMDQKTTVITSDSVSKKENKRLSRKEFDKLYKGEAKITIDEFYRLYQLQEKNPDDIYGVYINNKKTNSKGPEVIWYGPVENWFHTYESYMQKADTLKGEFLQRPTTLPEEYTFVEGQIMANLDPKFKKDLREEAAKNGKAVHSKKYTWNTMEGSLIKFINGDNYVIFNFYEIDSKHKEKQKDYKYYQAKKDATNKKPQENELTWYGKDKSYRIVTNADNPLTKEELIILSETMIGRN
ncbi:M56 family metallopeptidase [Paenibacillus arenosi]|uniref:M56 family metallopeptidase n=1 Tax=Paenibacillus arenosi TaxID=2774142 RepID=A0ABR9B2A8_9BACL|nr:M56 family metallopeptidase [Paenibacillus arenosi]MBD8499580.1 M56 family metallopeptidase [Paenibacillus arenosi]